MVRQCVKMALKAIAANRLRSFLTMLGIIVGVIALVVLVSLVTSAGDAVTEQVNELGTDLIRVTILDDGGRPLRLSEMPTFAEHEAIGAVAPLNQVGVIARRGHESGRATVHGTTPSYYHISGRTLIAGRFIQNADVENSTHVAVVSQEAAERLFDSLDVLGETIALDGRPFRIVGILEDQETLTSLFFPGFTIYVPYTSAIRLSEALNSNITTMLVSASGTDMDLAESAMEDMLLERFRRDEGAFGLFNQSLLADAMEEITSMLAYLLGGVAAISLLVGGIGIMNIMLVSVMERTKEIGVRKAIGAGRMSILLQFLIEALVICLIGSLIGVAVSWAILQVASVLVGDLMDFTLSAGVVSVAVVFSIFIGLLFGLYPAGQAANKRPIDALRYEG